MQITYPPGCTRRGAEDPASGGGGPLAEERPAEPGLPGWGPALEAAEREMQAALAEGPAEEPAGRAASEAEQPASGEAVETTAVPGPGRRQPVDWDAEMVAARRRLAEAAAAAVAPQPGDPYPGYRAWLQAEDARCALPWS